MSFLRSNSGLSNLAIFRSVDVVIFTEGGENKAISDESEETSYRAPTLDKVFWENILTSCKFRYSFALYSIGSKHNLNYIAQRIESEVVNNVIVAMDTDTDDLDNRKLSSPLILYTYGYSWENDVFDEEVIVDYMRNRVANTAEKDNLTRRIRDIYESNLGLFSDLLSYFYVEQKTQPEYEPIPNIERFITEKSKIPLLNKGSVEGFLKDRRSKLTKNSNSGEQIDKQLLFRYVHGKWVQGITYKILIYLSVEHFGISTTLPKDYFSRDFLERYSRISKPKNFDYYYSMIQKANKCLDLQKKEAYNLV